MIHSNVTKLRFPSRLQYRHLAPKIGQQHRREFHLCLDLR
jgi:hypothetical protein